jgi:hypothetical protein
MYIPKIIFTFFLSLLIFMISGCGEDDEPPCANPCPNCPVVESIFPTTAAVGDTIVITGQNFGRFGEGADDKVTIGGVEAIFSGNKTDTQITVEIPEDFVEGEVVVCSVNPGNTNLNNVLCSDDPCVTANYPSPVLKEQIITFNKEIPLNIPNAKAVNVLQTDDGGYMILCNNAINSSYLSQGIMLVFIDNNGEFTSSIEFDLDMLEYSNIEAIDFLRKKDGGLAILGFNSDKVHLGEGKMFLIITDERGEAAQVINFPILNFAETPQALLQADNERLIILGIRQYNESFIRVVSPSGESITSSIIQTEGILNFDALDFDHGNNEREYIIVGVGANLLAGLPYKSMIVYAENNGNQVPYQSAFGTENGLPFLSSISKTENGFIGVGLDPGTPSNLTRVKLYTFSNNLSHSVKLDIPNGVNYHNLPLLLPYNTDQYALLYSVDKGEGREIALTLYNLKTEERSDKHFIGEGWSTDGNNIMQTKDGGFFIVGETYYANNSKLYVIKTDALGNL